MKRFAAYYLPPAALVVLITLGVGLILTQAELDKLKDHQSTVLASVTEVLFNALDTPVNHLRGLVREPAINQAFRSAPSEARAIMGEHLQTLLYRNPLYDRARWLSATGLEVARVDDAPEGPMILPEHTLLDQAAHEVYQRAIRLAPGQIHLSALDLSGEGAAIAIPDKPILRLAMRLPVIEGRDQGLLVIAYRAQRLFDRIRTLIPPGPEHQPMLLNPDGFWLLAPTQQPPAKAGGLKLRTESPDTGRIDPFRAPPFGNCRLPWA